MRAELHDRRGGTRLAEQVWKSGLLYLVNAAVLHHHGLALGVQQEGDQIVGLVLYETDDPDGFTFDERATEQGRRKLREAGLR
jgi:hypothetical protein